jgi:ribosomal protein L14
MIQKESWVFASDNTNINWIKTFHLYKGFHRKKTNIGFFIKGSARSVEPPRMEYKGFKYKYSVKGDIAKMFVSKSNLHELNKSSFEYRIKGNSGFILKKKLTPRSKFLNKPILRLLPRKKVKSLYKIVV